MIVKKPSILLYVHEPEARCLRNLCAGIEEEGVLYEVVPQTESDAVHLADKAAEESILGSGIGLSGTSAVLQLRGCPAGSPVFWIKQADAAACRALGADSARAIKKLPFKTEKGKNG